MSLNGKNIIVVGAGASIAVGVIEKLIENGANVLATFHDNITPSLSQTGAVLAYLNLEDAKSIENFCIESVSSLGHVDALVILAGFLPGKQLQDYTDSLSDKVMAVNFTGQVQLLRHMLKFFADGASILLVSSISGLRGSYDPIYASAKAAQIGLVKSLATWLAPKIRINAIAPGLIVDSTMYNSMTPQRRSYHRQQTPTGRLTTKDDIAGIINSLCQNEWSNLNGQVLQINGGAYV